MLDLSKMDTTKLAEAGFEFELVFPNTGEPTGAFVKVRGEDSPEVKTYARKKFQEFRMQEQAAKRRGKEYEMTPEEAEDLSIETAIVRTISWSGITEGGKAVDFSRESAERIYRAHPWIRRQVMEESNNVSNFRPE